MMAFDQQKYSISSRPHLQGPPDLPTNIAAFRVRVVRIFATIDIISARNNCFSMAPLAPHSCTGPSRRARDPGGPETRADNPSVALSGSSEVRGEGIKEQKLEREKLGCGLGVMRAALPLLVDLPSSHSLSSFSKGLLKVNSRDSLYAPSNDPAYTADSERRSQERGKDSGKKRRSLDLKREGVARGFLGSGDEVGRLRGASIRQPE
jgi:hypothetical protein